MGGKCSRDLAIDAGLLDLTAILGCLRCGARTFTATVRLRVG
jgi:hypothetical protein